MKITIISIGKFAKSPLKSVFEEYQKRLKWKITLKELEVKNSNNLSVQTLKEEEGKLILKNIDKSSKIISCDENGQQFSSKKFAKIISDFKVQGTSSFYFIIGGANGLSEEVLNKSNLQISLSKMTFPHMLVRVILIEQIYRAFTILNNHPYHKD